MNPTTAMPDDKDYLIEKSKDFGVTWDPIEPDETIPAPVLAAASEDQGQPSTSLE